MSDNASTSVNINVKNNARRVVKKGCLAYSAGLDTSVIIPWLKENYGCEVVAVAGDGGPADETEHPQEKGYRTGAGDFHLLHAKEEIAAQDLLPVLKARGGYGHHHPPRTPTAP